MTVWRNQRGRRRLWRACSAPIAGLCKRRRCIAARLILPMAIAKPFLALSREAIFDSCVNKARISSLKPIWMALALEGNRLVRYPMGVGLAPQDLIDVVAHGADIFDCVAPTRNARHGALYCGEWRVIDGW